MGDQMTTTLDHTDAIDTEAAELLRSRAASLRAQADALPELLATTYRRRAAELELQAWVTDVESGVPYDLIRPAA
jgi:hypothetical protein